MNTTKAPARSLGSSRYHIMSRRSLTKGVAWAAPVVVASSMVPAFAGSAACIGLSTTFDSRWTYQNPASGTLYNGSSNRVYTGADRENYYTVVTTATSRQPATVRATLSLIVTSGEAGATGLQVGCSYTVRYALCGVQNQKETPAHQVMSVRMIKPDQTVVPGSESRYTTAPGATGAVVVPTVSSVKVMHKTADSVPFTFTPTAAGTYLLIAEFMTPTNYANDKLRATGLGFSSPIFEVA